MSRWRTLLTGFAFWTALGLLSFSYRHLDTVVRGNPEPFQIRLIEELTGTWGAGLLAILVARVVRRLRGRGVLLLWHAPALLLYSAAHTSWNWLTRTLLFPLAGLGAYDYGTMSWRYLMELGNDVLGYGVIALAVTYLDQQRDRQQQAMRLLTLETEVSQARLASLEARLQPHFLFNALNTISGVMYEDVATADRMLHRLSQLLRRTLDHQLLDQHGGLVTLQDELETLSLWTSIMTARFGDRLQVTHAVDEAAMIARVPSLLLQPLVENAVQHGLGGAAVGQYETPLCVQVTARVIPPVTHDQPQHPMLELCVSDNGVGWQGREQEALESGVGLSTTRRRLHTQYGAAASLELAAAEGGGAQVCLRLPLDAAHAH
jgi:two-component system, LytTR family, sensor kinase